MREEMIYLVFQYVCTQTLAIIARNDFTYNICLFSFRFSIAEGALAGHYIKELRKVAELLEKRKIQNKA